MPHVDGMPALSVGGLPSDTTSSVTRNPEDPLGPATYHRAYVSGSRGAMPAETYQYDIAFEAFLSDKEFWKNWKVVDCARNSAEESISKENATIRVVMDLPPEQKLYPTAYTPGFATLPHSAVSSMSPELSTETSKIPGLPPGYSVALDVFILEEAQIMLKHQVAFRGGSVDAKHMWLKKIVDKAAGSSGKVVEADSTLPSFAKFIRSPGTDRPEASLRPPVGSLRLESRDAGLSKQVVPFSDRYGDHSKVAPHVPLGRGQVYEENMLVSAFGGGSALPKREGGTWASLGGKSKSEVKKQLEEGKHLDDELEKLLWRTREPDDHHPPPRRA
mmetsp:Transcript_15327/g.33645  ORF Transcript_15327/g.33645 Transcript_15327/m.33645 type:complete len:331 (+) Transcript_15327:129-1121(+)